MHWLRWKRNGNTVVITALLTLGLAAIGFFAYSSTRPNTAPVTDADALLDAEKEAVVDTSPERRATFLATGDMLIHDDVYEDFRTDDGFDFTPAFQHVKPMIRSADFAATNQETPLGGEELGLSGLYVANSPQELGDGFVDAGFNMIQLANNHAFDRGMPGIERTLAFWKKYGGDVVTSGLYVSQAERDKTPVIERNDVKLAFLSYTYGSNLGPLPHPYNLNEIDRQLMSRDIEEAKKRSDAIVVGVHWGTELQRQPNAYQRELAQWLADQGVDIVYGTHPHVLQPPEMLEAADGHQTFVMYSVGNFLSIHTEDPLYTLTGALMGIDIVKSPDGEIVLEKPFATLTWNYFTQAETEFRVIPFDRMTADKFWWGDWESHRKNMRRFIRQDIPGLELRAAADYGEGR